MSGVSPEAVDQYLTDELADLEAQLSAIYPPERVKAIIHELLKGY